MVLPVMSVPEFTTKIPSTGKQIKYRPFLVKEQKVLLMAVEGKDVGEMMNAMIKILESCILTKGIDVKKMSTFDVEYIFLKIRSKSVGEVVNIIVGHKEGDCGHKTDVEINLDEIKVEGEIKNGKVMLTDTVGVHLRYPSMSDVVSASESQNLSQELILKSIEYIFDENNVYNEFSKEELEQWVETLSSEQFEKIGKFFQDMPALKHTIKWKCPKCGKDDSLVLEGLHNFFTSD